jgi:hypothetical protein
MLKDSNSKGKKMKKIIYGESNFRKIKINNDYFYIDKTRFIETLENTNESFLIFLRPRRFGKSLFLSTLQYYYDEKSKDEFKAIFNDTYIGKNSTPLKNSYRILFFEFSGINVDAGVDRIYESFANKIRNSCMSYLKTYNYPIENSYELQNITIPASIIDRFLKIIQEDNIYLLIDEYDQFANAILAHSMDEFLKIVSKGGFVRSFYEVLKGATQTGTIQKMFITGVTPITLDSLSSGFNIVSNISHHKNFNAMAGFTQNEVDYSLRESIFKRCNIERNELLAKVKTWYNGYLFNSKAKNRVYNSTLLNYFISQYDYDDCTMPTKMLDVNVASDYKAIMKLFNIGDSDRNYKILEELIEKNAITGIIKDRYDLNREFTRDDFITLIYSMGFITIKNEIVGGLYEFEIPNYVIKILYFNYFIIELERRNQFRITTSIGEILTQLLLGDINPFKNQLNEVIKTLSNRDHQGFDEKYFQVISLALLSFAEFYFIDSQPEKNRKYPDILLIGRDERVPNNYLFELKWMKNKDNYNAVKRDGIKQVEEYLELDKVKSIPKLRSYLLIGSKDGVEFIKIDLLQN